MELAPYRIPNPGRSNSVQNNELINELNVYIFLNVNNLDH
jgi:hypothetical protein